MSETPTDRMAAAAAFVATARPESTTGFTALLKSLDAPPPSFLADVPATAPLASEGYPLHLHTLFAGGTPAEGAEAAGVALARLREILCSPAVLALLADENGGYVPTWREANPRLGFRPARPSRRAKPTGTPDEVAERCEVTGRRFALPAGAPVPCLYFDFLEADRDPRRDERSHPTDRNPAHYTLHPALAAEGVPAVLAALWGKLQGDLVEVAEKIEAAAGLASLIAGVTPADVPDGEVPRGLVDYAADETGGYRAVPAGWRDLGMEK